MGPKLISVVVATFGDMSWKTLAEERAIPSAQEQSQPCELYLEHGTTLAQARNVGARNAQGETLVFLDADDQLDKDYILHMERAIPEGDFLLQPSTVGVHPDGRIEDPVLIKPAANLLERNHMVIGTAVRREQFLRVGGFRELPAYEDWDLFLRCWVDGAQMIQVPEAEYRVHVSQGRNSLDRTTAIKVYNSIRNEYMQKAKELNLI